MVPNRVHSLPMTSPQSGSTPQNTFPLTGAALWLPLALTSLSALMFTLDGSMNAISLPYIAEEFNTPPAGVVWVSVALQFMILGLALPVSALSTSFGRRRLFTIGVGVFLVGLVGSFFSPDLPTLIASRIVQGVGCALFLSTRNAIAMEVFPPERRGMALGIIIAAVGLGSASGPLIGGQLIDVFGWRSIYVTVAPLSLAIVVLSFILLRREERQPLVNFDLPGAMLVFVGLGALLVALNRTSAWGAASIGIIALSAVGVVLMAGFVWREGQAIKPVLELTIFRSAAVVVTSMGLVFQVMGNSAAILVLPFFLVRSLGLNSTASGALFAISPAFMIVGGLIGGRLSGRTGVSPVMVTGMLCQVVGVVMLLLVNEHSGLVHISSALAIMGMGAGIYQTAAGSAQMNAVPPGHLGTASALFIGLVMMASSTGGTLGGILMNSSYAAGGALQISRVADSYHNVAIAGTVVLAIGMVNALYYHFRIAGRPKVTEATAPS
jgi:MFS family permease